MYGSFFWMDRKRIMEFNFIAGFMFGFELVEDDATYLVLDLFLIRILIVIGA